MHFTGAHLQAFKGLDEIHAGDCEGLSYEEVSVTSVMTARQLHTLHPSQQPF
jgi:hypothetical protein